MDATGPDAAPNPFEPPAAALGGAPGGPADAPTEDETRRRRLMGLEFGVRVLAWFHVFGAVLVVVLTGLAAASLFAAARPSGLLVGLAAGAGCYALVVAGLCVALGVGLYTFRPWARPLEVALCVVLLLLNVVATWSVVAGGGRAFDVVGGSAFRAIVPAVVLFMLLSRKASLIFSAEHPELVYRTSHLRYRPGWVVKGCLGVVALWVLAALIAGVMAWLMSD
ncbi:MAG: hypothetical protein U0835_04655 [Isosphaeraceae bacterium]